MSKLRASLITLGDIMLGIVLILLIQIDKLVNDTLYGYGLTFSTEWAQPYWLMLRISLLLIVVTIFIISVVELPQPSFRED